MKIKVSKRFWVTPNDVLNSPLLSMKAKGLYWYIQSKPEDWDFAAERIATQSTDGRDSIRAGLDELEKVGYLIRHKYKDEKGKFKVDYELLEEPKPTTENPSPPATENPTSDNPKSENPTSEKPSSKKERNTNKEIVIEEEQKEAPLPFINSLEKLLFITPLAGDKEIQNLYKMFRENREQTKNKLTANAEVLFFGVLRDIPINRKKYEKDIAVAMIKNTVSKNWRGLFQLKDHEADEIFKKNKIEEAKKRIEPTEEQKKNHRNIQEVQEITRYKDTLGEKEREELRKQAEEEVKKVAPSIAGTLLETMIKTAENRIVRGRIYTK